MSSVKYMSALQDIYIMSVAEDKISLEFLSARGWFRHRLRPLDGFAGHWTPIQKHPDTSDGTRRSKQQRQA